MNDEPALTTGSQLLVSADVVAIVPTLRLSERLDRCIASVLASDTDRDVRVLVVVNGGDGSAEPLVDGRTTVVQVGVNLGFSGALTFGASLAESEFVWVVQDDMTVEPDCLAALDRALDSSPDLGAARPVMLDEKGRVTRRSGGVVLTPDGAVVRGWPMRSRPLDGLQQPRELTYVAGSGMLVRRQAWDDAGGWGPEYYPVQWSDADFCRRLAQAGWAFRLEPTAHARHKGSSSTPRHLRFLLSFHNGRKYRARWIDEAPAPTNPPNVHPAVTREQLAAMVTSSNGALSDVDAWMASRSLPHRARQRIRGTWWTLRAFVDPRL